MVLRFYKTEELSAFTFFSLSSFLVLLEWVTSARLRLSLAWWEVEYGRGDSKDMTWCIFHWCSGEIWNHNLYRIMCSIPLYLAVEEWQLHPHSGPYWQKVCLVMINEGSLVSGACCLTFGQNKLFNIPFMLRQCMKRDTANLHNEKSESFSVTVQLNFTDDLTITDSVKS